VESQAQYTDGNTNQWNTRLDWLGFGRMTQDTDPLTNQAVTHRDTNGLPWLAADQLARRTRTFFDSNANPVKTVLPDDNYVQAQFDTTFNEVTSYTDENGGTTNYGLDAHGNVTTVTDALTKTWHDTFDGRGRLTLATRAIAPPGRAAVRIIGDGLASGN